MNKNKNKALRITAAVLSAVVMCHLSPNTFILPTYAATQTVVADEYFDGKGTMSEPFQIAEYADLLKLAELVNSGKSKYATACYVLTADIDTAGKEWTPIGTEKNKFKGTFNGNNHTIYEIKISGDNSTVGLFGYVYNGTVKNLDMTGGTINGKKDVGAIAGYNAGTISGCQSTVIVSSEDTNVGGIAGRNSGTIDSCSTETDIMTMGEAGGGIAGTNTGKIINCGNSSRVSAEYAGGIVGNNSGNVLNCYNMGEVGVSSNYAGGIVGKNMGDIHNCYSGEFIDSSAYYAGGIAAYNGKGTVSDCYYITISDEEAVAEKVGGTVNATAMSDRNMISASFAETLNKNLKTGYGTWKYSINTNNGFPTIMSTAGNDLVIMSGEKYQTGDATPESSDGKTSAVKYTGYASRWFTGGTGKVFYEIVSENASGTITINEETGYIIYTPNRTDAKKVITVEIAAHDTLGYCMGNVIITINVNEVPPNKSNVKNSRISKTKADYDKENGNKDNLSIDIKLTLNGNSLMRIEHDGEILEEGTDYTIRDDDEVTIKRSYLSTLPVGKNIITFIFTAGASPDLVVDVSDTSLETYTVKFMSQSKPYHIEEDIPRGSTIKLPTKPTRSDANFKGWYTKSNGNGDEFTTKTVIEKDMTVYANWEYKKSTSSSKSSKEDKVKTYSIKASATKGGTISPSGSVTVEDGEGQKYRMTPDKGYIVADVTVDNQSVGPVDTYTFSDVDKGHTIKVTFKEDDGKGPNANHKPYMRGYSDGTFHPDSPVTRTEAAVIISRISKDFDDMKYYENTFYDVGGDIWYQKYIGYTVSKGYISGYEGDVFLPDKYITRAEFCKLIHKYLNLKVSKKTTRFRDCKDHWADNYIKDLVDKEIIKGYQNGLFNPDGEITRAEAAKIVNAVMERTPNIEADIENPYSDIDQYHWAYYEVLEASVPHLGKELHK